MTRSFAFVKKMLPFRLTVDWLKRLATRVNYSKYFYFNQSKAKPNRIFPRFALAAYFDADF